MGSVAHGLESLESRRLLAFVASGVSTVGGDEYQSVDAMIPVSGGYVSAGTFTAGTDFGNGVSPAPRGYSDLFLTLVKGSKTSLYTIGGGSGSDGKIKVKDNRAEFAALPTRVSEEYPFGVSSSPRRADEYIRAMKIGPDGKLYVVVVFKKDISLNTQNPRALTLSVDDSYDLYDSAILRYSVGSKLTFESAFMITGPFNDIVNDIDFDSAGNLVLAGSFERRCDFDPGSGTKLFEPDGRGDAFVAKYTRRGELIFVSQFGGDSARPSEIDAANGVVVDSNDNIYVGGTFASDADFDPRAGKANRFILKSSDSTDAFTMKLNADGTLAWARAQGGKKSDGVRDVTLAPNGGVYSVGYFEDEADLDSSDARQIFQARDEKGGSTPYATDLFLNRFDADGNQQWVKPIAGDGFELIANANTDASGNLVLAGSFFGSADFDGSKRVQRLTSPASSLDDGNQKDRDNAYSGFIAKYSPTSKLLDATQIDGRREQDLFLNGASLDGTGNVYIGGRYRLGLAIPNTSVSIGTTTDNDRREDAYALIFNAGLEPIA